MPTTSLRVAVTGGTGFVGGHVLPRLLDAGHTVKALVRDPAGLGVTDSRLETIQGTLSDDGALARLVRDADAVVQLVGIIKEVGSKGQTFERVHVEGTRRLLAAARSAEVKRWVQMSALGSRPNAVSTYHQTKWAAEEAVRGGGIPYTIIRPSIIHGPDGEFMEMIKSFWTGRFPPFVPYFGAGPFGRGGAGRLQPVWVEDVARCFADALTRPQTAGETYPLGGPNVFTWPELYKTCKPHLPGARDKCVCAVPVWYANCIANLPGVPFNKDQVIMSQEDSTCQIGKVQADFGFELAPFEPTFAQYASQIQ